MSKISFNKVTFKRLAMVAGLSLMSFTIASCQTNHTTSFDGDATYLTVGNESVSYQEVWDELRWNATNLFADKKLEAVLNTELDDIKNVLADPNNANYKNYQTRLKSYLLEEVYGLEFNLDIEKHYEEIADLDSKTKKHDILAYADSLSLSYDLSMSIDDIVKALENDTLEDLDSLNKLYEYYYLDLAKENFAKNKLAEEIKEKDEEALDSDDEDNVGYFTKDEITSLYESDFLNQGDSESIIIKFASEDEALDTLRAFGIKVNDSKLCYLTNTPANYNDYLKYYDEFDFTNSTDYMDLSSTFGDSLVLQLYIAIYNYTYTYRSNLENLDLDVSSAIIDQRSTTNTLIQKYNELLADGDWDANKDDERIENIVNTLKAEEENYNNYVKRTAESLKEYSESMYTYVYETLETPLEASEDGDYTRYTTSPHSADDAYYMAYKISYAKTAYDAIYEEDITDDDLYDAIVDYKDEGNDTNSLYEAITAKLKDEDLTSSYIDEKINEVLEDVKVKIYDEAMEITYAKDNDDYNRTLSGPSDDNVLAEFTYEDTTVYAYLTTEEKDGIFDVLDYRTGSVTASNLISTKLIKATDEYKNISQEDIDNFYQTIEYTLAIFANDGLSSNGYPASLGKYNFLMLYYHTSDIDEIVNDVFKVGQVSSELIINYNSDEIINFFDEYTQLAYENYFSATALELEVYLDINEDGEADDFTIWDEVSEEKGVDLRNEAKELINLVYSLLETSSSAHSDALTEIVEKYNTSSRHLPKEGDRFDDENYDPIGDEWDFAEYRALGLVLTTNELTVTNTSTDVDNKVKEKIRAIYNKPDFNIYDTYPSQYIENPTDEGAILEYDNAYRYYVITSATGKTSAKYESYNDIYNVYQDLHYMYNNDCLTVENIYNDGDTITKNQIRAFLFEYLVSETSNLIPTDIATALQNYFQPVLTRFLDNATQSEVITAYVIKHGTYNFSNPESQERFSEIRRINQRISDDYQEYDGVNEEDFNNFYGWWENLPLMNGGNN